MRVASAGEAAGIIKVIFEFSNGLTELFRINYFVQQKVAIYAKNKWFGLGHRRAD